MMYCPQCGNETEDGAHYCKHCGEKIKTGVSQAETGVEPVEEIERTTRVEHQCQACGEMLQSGEPPCRHCGGMDIETRPVKSEPSETQTTSSVPGYEPNSSRNTHFYIGAILATIGVLLLPYFFFLIALPEAIASLVWGVSIQDNMSNDARNNPFLSGSFLIFRWFGNFLLLMVVLGFIIGILLVL